MEMQGFDETVEMIRNHRLANPRFASEWSTNRADIANELDVQTCLHLAAMGLSAQFCVGDPGSFLSSQPPQRQWLGRNLRAAAAGASSIITGIKTLTDWLGHGGKPVSPALAESRAAICKDCPKNSQGGFGSFFTTEASDVIRHQLAIKHDMELSTIHDESLGVCDACRCPLKLKPWCEISYIREHMKPEIKDALDKRCWVLNEP